MKKALKLILVVFICTLPLFGTMFYTAKNLLKFCDEEIPYYVWNKKITQDHSRMSKYDTVILGDSVANSNYCPEYLSETTINLALGGTTPVENYFTLKKVLNSGAPIKNVLISFVDLHLQQEDCLYSRVFYSHLLSFWDELEIIRDATKFQDQSVIHQGYILDWLGYRLWFPSKYLPSLLNSGINKRKEFNLNMIHLVDNHRGTYISRDIRENLDYNNLEFASFFVNPLYDYYLTKIIHLCKSHNLQIKFVIPPFHPRIVKTKQYLAQRKNYYNDIIKGHSNCEIINFDETEEFSDGTLFIDLWHMNMRGALKFSNLLNNRLSDSVFIDAQYEKSSPQTIAGKTDYILIDSNLESLLMRVDKDFSAVIYRRHDYKINNDNCNEMQRVCFVNTKKIPFNEKDGILSFELGNVNYEIGRNNRSDIFVLIFHKTNLVVEKRFVVRDDDTLSISF